MNEKYKNDLKEVVKNYYWTKKDGSKIKFKNMKRSHLLNCINMTERNGEKELNRLLKCELAIREEKYNEFFESDDLSDLTRYTIKIEGLQNDKLTTI